MVNIEACGAFEQGSNALQDATTGAFGGAEYPCNGPHWKLDSTKQYKSRSQQLIPPNFQILLTWEGFKKYAGVPEWPKVADGMYGIYANTPAIGAGLKIRFLSA